MAELPTVYAYRDNGCIQPLSRWRPRLIVCTQRRDHADLPGREFVVKLGQGAAGTAAQISEVVCGTLLDAGGVSALEPSLVQLGPAFAASYAPEQTVTPGNYFGTLRRTDVENGPPPNLACLFNPQEIIDIWAFDSWLVNIDRNTDGNLLLALDRGGKFRLVAADQSDCWGGTAGMADGSWEKLLADRGAAESVAFLDQAIYHEGGKGIQAAIQKVRVAAARLEQAMNLVPDNWWRQVPRLDRDLLTRALQSRLRRLENILDLAKWEGLDNATRGGQILF